LKREQKQAKVDSLQRRILLEQIRETLVLSLQILIENKLVVDAGLAT
jgi:hypothetical protein